MIRGVHSARSLRSVLVGAPLTARDPADPDQLQIFQFTPIDKALSTVGVAVGAYHGFKRNDSIGWAIAWGILGGMFPVITTAIAVAQGVGKRHP